MLFINPNPNPNLNYFFLQLFFLLQLWCYSDATLVLLGTTLVLLWCYLAQHGFNLGFPKTFHLIFPILFSNSLKNISKFRWQFQRPLTKRLVTVKGLTIPEEVTPDPPGSHSQPQRKSFTTHSQPPRKSFTSRSWSPRKSFTTHSQPPKSFISCSWSPRPSYTQPRGSHSQPQWKSLAPLPVIPS